MERQANEPDPIAVLAHPVVIVSLAGWLVNDWILKPWFANELTGKLSDVFAMVVFPLLIAVVAGPVSRHPLRWGLGINTVFFAAINLVGPVDRFVERALSLVLPSTLTMDPTDLVVLPAMVVAAWVWRRVQRSVSDARRTARRRAGRVVFAAGALTCLATSAPEEARSDPHSGSILLTAEQPIVSMPLEYDLNGASSPHLDVVITLTAYGAGNGDDLPAYGTVDWQATPVQLSFELTDPSWAPVHLEWRAEALGEVQDCGLFRCSDGDVATLSIEVPPLESKPVPDQRIELPPTGQGDDRLVFMSFVIDEAAPPALELPGAGTFTARLGTRQLRPRDNTRTWPIPVPASCATPCRVSIPVTYGGGQSLSFGVFGSVSAIEIETPPLVDARAELTIPVAEIAANGRASRSICLRLADPTAAQTPFVGLAGIAFGFDETIEPVVVPIAASDTSCLAEGRVWVGEEERADHDQIVIVGSVRTTADRASASYEIVVLD